MPAKLPSLEQFEQEKRRRATERERIRLAQDGDAIKARCKTLAGFVREAWHVLHPSEPYVHGWHIDFICAHLEAITFGRFLDLGLENRLLANEPPGTMKSLLINVFWTAWEWGPCGMPWLQNIATSYREDFCKRDSRRTRDLVASDWYQALWGETVNLTRTGEASFENSARGWYEAMPFGSLTGGRAHRVKIDDPHSIDTAESDADRARAAMRFRESVPLRLNDPKTSAIVLIMQRLHGNDLSGIALALKLGYIHVMLPMEFEPERACVTPIGSDPRTYDGELLFPERFSRAVVERDKTALGSHAAAGQFQQRPTPREGGMFKRVWFEFVRAVPAGARTVRGWDLAATKAKNKGITARGPAFTAGVKLSAVQGTYYIEHSERLRGSPAEVEAAIKTTATHDGHSVRISVPQDPGQAAVGQKIAIAKLLAGYDVRFSPESGDKTDRANPVSAQAEAGNVKIVQTGDTARDAWIEPFLEELCLFPGGAFKDQTDALSRAFAELLSLTRADVPDIGVPIQVGAGPGLLAPMRSNGTVSPQSIVAGPRIG